MEPQAVNFLIKSRNLSLDPQSKKKNMKKKKKPENTFKFKNINQP